MRDMKMCVNGYAMTWGKELNFTKDCTTCQYENALIYSLKMGPKINGN